MPIEWNVARDRRLVFATARCPVVSGEVEDYLQGMMRQGGHSFAKVFVVDAEADTTPTTGIAALSEVIRDAPVHDGPYGPVALVALSDRAFAGVEAFLRKTAVDRQLRVFRSLETAAMWLKEIGVPGEKAP